MLFILLVGCSQIVSTNVISVNENVLIDKEGLKYQPDSTIPYDGKAFELWDNGNKKLEGSYQNGKQEGSWIWWYFTGQKMCEGNFVNGEREGTWTWWYERGPKEREENYIDGKLNGKSIFWSERGQTIGESTYKNGKIVWE